MLGSMQSNSQIYIPLSSVAKSILTPHVKVAARPFAALKESAMIKTYVRSDVVMKIGYFSLVALAFGFVSMLLMTGLHP
jgi:hypothetical protein